MPQRNKITPEQKKLIRRYLLWCYKTTKEELDRIDRKSTQLQVDYFMKGEFLKALETSVLEDMRPYQAKVDEFTAYIAEKEKNLSAAKFSDKIREEWQPQYWYLVKRLDAIKKAVRYFLGDKILKSIEALYEREMTRRIMESREH